MELLQTTMQGPVSSLPPSSGGADGEPPTVCALEHRAFRRFGEVVFRLAESDNAPSMLVSLGERSAAVPLRALQREMAIPDNSPDGRMLALIAQSLDFVTSLMLGDPLPAEVLDGNASWTPEPSHKALAVARLRVQLVAWLQPEAVGVASPDITLIRRLDEDPAMRTQVQKAMDEAATRLGLEDSTQVVAALETLAEELGYIEALRERLLVRVRDMSARIDRVQRAGRFNLKRRDMVVQVARLSAIALQRIAARFDEIDALSQNVIEALSHLDSQRSLIRSSRDWLYRLSRAWGPLLAEWNAAADLPDTALWKLIETTYQFLAPRYMQAQEWLAARNSRPADPGLHSAMTW